MLRKSKALNALALRADNSPQLQFRPCETHFSLNDTPGQNSHPGSRNSNATEYSCEVAFVQRTTRHRLDMPIFGFVIISL
jgi:hypothetical protein